MARSSSSTPDLETDESSGDSSWAAPIIGLLIVTLAVMGPLCAADFCSWDDSATIAHNPRLNPPSWRDVGYYWSHGELWLYVPVTYTVWSGLAVVARLDAPDPVSGVQMNPWVFHGANVAIHLANVLLVVAILRLLFPRIGRGAVFVGAVLFAVHPVQVEAVAWASGAKDLLCGFFSFLAVWQYLRYARSGGTRTYLAGMAALLLGVLSKPTAMVVPAIVAALDLWVVGRPVRQVARSVWPWFVVVIPFMVVARVLQPAGEVAGLPLWERPLLAGATVAFYVYKLLAPLHLAFDYGLRPSVLAQTNWFYVAWIVPVGLGAWFWRVRRRWAAPWASLMVFLAGIVAVIGLTRFLFQIYSTVADHYLYLSMLGPAMLAAGALHRMTPRRRMVATWVGAVLAGVYGVRAAFYVPAWRDAITLDRHTIVVNPKSFFSLNAMGDVYQSRGEGLEAVGETAEAYRDYAAAVDWYGRSIEALPRQRRSRGSRAWALLAMARLETNPGAQVDRLREAAAEIERFRAVIPEGTGGGGGDGTGGTGASRFSDAVVGEIYLRIGEWDKAANELERAVMADPQNQALAERLRRAREARSGGARARPPDR